MLMNNFFKRKIDKSYRAPPFFVVIKSYYLGGGGVKTELENMERLIESDLNSAGIWDHPPLFLLVGKIKSYLQRRGGGKNALKT